MIEKTTSPKKAVISGGTQVSASPRRLKFGPFSKEPRYAIDGKMARSKLFANYREIPKEKKVEPAACRKTNIPYQLGKTGPLPVDHNRLSAAFWGRSKPHVDNLSKRRPETEITNTNERRTSELMKMP